MTNYNTWFSSIDNYISTIENYDTIIGLDNKKNIKAFCSSNDLDYHKFTYEGKEYTIHAGEADGAESVKTALKLGAKRIGHGVRVNEDPELLEYIVKNEIPLEMCPNSNRQTKAVSDMTKYPLQEYLAKGVKVTINTDDPAICRTNLKNEFSYIEKMYGITSDQKKQLLLNAADAAFCSENFKKYLKENILK